MILVQTNGGLTSLPANKALDFKGQRIISQMNQADCPEQLRDLSKEAVEMY